jgi:hypothetical protein
MSITSSDQDRAIEALSIELDGETLVVSPLVGDTMAVRVQWDEGELEIGVAGFVYPLSADTPDSIMPWIAAWNKPLHDQLMGDVAT